MLGIFKLRAQDSEEDERRELMEALADTKRSLEVARESFEFAREPELVDATAFEIKALEARYSYLLRLVREQGYDNQPAFKPLR